jgi:hypothetical protein
MAPDVVHDGFEDRRGQAGPHDDVPVGVQGAAALVMYWLASALFHLRSLSFDACCR